MTPADILPVENWILFEKEINNKSDLNAAVYDAEGTRITSFQKWANKFCPAVKTNEKGGSFICALAHQNLSLQAMQTKETAIGECDAGLLKFVVPIFVDDEFLGVTGACGAFLDADEVETFLVNKITGIDTDEIESMAGDIRDIKNDEVESLIVYIEEQVKQIVSDFEKRS